MKLRNKKTGKVTSDYSYILLESTHYKTYNSLAELNAEWEDYVPKDPLLDFYDERKLVRHWAEVHNIKEVWVHGIGDGKEVVEIYDVEDGLMRLTLYRPEKVVLDKAYTIAELCGEEEK